MNWLKGLTLLATIAMLSGCSDKGTTVKKETISPKQAVRTALENIVQSGQGGSEIGMVIEELGKLRADNPQLAESLVKDAEKMMSMNSSSQIKAAAKEMIKKLDAGGSGGAKK